MKLGILGNKNSILGFKAIGLDVFDNLKNVDLKKYGILFITEDCSKKYSKQLDEISGQALPAILTVPSAQGATKQGIQNLKKIVEKAVGSDILKLDD